MNSAFSQYTSQVLPYYYYACNNAIIGLIHNDNSNNSFNEYIYMPYV